MNINSYKNLEDRVKELANQLILLKIAQEKSQYIGDILDKVSDAVIYTDLDLTIQNWNKAAENIYGFRADEVKGKSLFEITQQECSKILAEQISENYSWTGTVKQKRKDGTVIRIKSTISMLKDNLGNPIGTFAVNQLISNPEISESAALKRAEQSFISQKMDALLNLTAEITSDFNNTVAGITGYLEIAEQEYDHLQNTHKYYLKDALKSREEALKFIKLLWSVSKTSRSRKTCTNLYEFVEDVFVCLEEMNNFPVEKSIKFKDRLIQVAAEKPELKDVFINLGKNSYHAIEEKGDKYRGLIKVSAELHKTGQDDFMNLSDGEYIHIIFEDNGIGMPPDICSKAFNPMFSTKRKSINKVKGLGLTMVYNTITKKLDGHIKIESEQEKGTKVHLFIPKGEPGKNENSSNTPEVNNSNEVILLVDDEASILRLATLILEKFGFKIATATSGKEALELYKVNMENIGLVILDLNMPEMSGETVLAKLLEINKDVKVIISSGDDSEFENSGVFSKVKAFVNKPYRIKQLARITEKVLNT